MRSSITSMFRRNFWSIRELYAICQECFSSFGQKTVSTTESKAINKIYTKNNFLGGNWFTNHSILELHCRVIRRVYYTMQKTSDVLNIDAGQNINAVELQF